MAFAQMLICGFVTVAVATHPGVALAASDHSPARIATGASRGAENLSPGAPFILTDDSGHKVTSETYFGAWHPVIFGYADDPNCAAAINKIISAVRDLGVRASLVIPILITIDPARDSSTRLHSYLSQFSHPVVGLVGDMKQTETVANAYQVTFVLNDPAHSGLDRLTNTKFFYILDPGGKVRAFLPEWIPSDRLTRVLQNLVSSSTETPSRRRFASKGPK